VNAIQGVSRRRKRPTTTDSKHKLPIAPNVLNREFTASAPNQKWLGDITYIDTLEGFLYLASLEDVFSRRIVGWAMADHMDTSLVAGALHMALFHRQPQGHLLHHSEAYGDVPFAAASMPVMTTDACLLNAALPSV
jgi:putative transposase